MGNYNDFDLDVKIGVKNSQGGRLHSDAYVCGTTNSPSAVCASNGCGGTSANCWHTYKPCSHGRR